MKLSSDEGRAIAFVLGLIALAGVARVVTRPAPGVVPAAAEIDPATLEDESQAKLVRQRALDRPLAADERIDVNGAAADELDRLPGVGAALAERIVAERERAGAFDSAADLRAVPGVGPAVLARLAPHLAFGPGAGLPRRVAVAGPETDGGPARPRGGARPANGEASERAAPAAVDVNRATASELEALPGIGPVLAAKIVAKRDSLRGFGTLDDLLKVRGIGPATLERLKPYLRT